MFIGSGATICRHVERPVARAAVLVVVWALATVGMTGIFGLGAWHVLGAASAAAAFLLVSTTARGAILAVIALGTIVLLLSGQHVPDTGVWAAWATLPETAPLVRLGVTPQVIAAGIGLLLFLGDAANTVVRAVLESAGVSGAAERDDDRALLESLTGARAEHVPFRGGRYVGALERWLLVVLLSAGALPLAVALLAAKGVVRFPEVQRDVDGGSRAEYFLVGTLASLGLALGAVGYLALVR